MPLPTATHTTQQPPATLCLLGPTASGKTAAALALAAQFPIEIISVDSALVYRDMDIGTAKPSVAEQARCPHHLIDVISPEQSYSAARFISDAQTLTAAIRARGNIPLLCGGTMLYFKALREGLSDLPQADAELRQQINERAARLGWPALHAELALHDPETAQRLESTDAQRIQRTLEIFYLTHQPASLLYRRQADQAHTLPSCPLHLLALQPDDRTILHQRIEQRFTTMLHNGLVDEVEQLRGKYTLTPDLPSIRTVGYRQTWEYLENEYDYDTLRFRGIVATRQLAKRQLTWMRQFRENWNNWTEFNCLDTQLHSRLQQHVDRILTRTRPTAP